MSTCRMKMLKWGLAALSAGLCWYCGSDGPDVSSDVTAPPDTVSTPDTGREDTSATPGDTSPDLAPLDTPPPLEDTAPAPQDTATDLEPPPFPWGLPPTEELETPHGYQALRTIIHLHSLYSHDACDNEPVFEDGTFNEACLDDLREALCTTRVDIAMMSEHYSYMADTPDFNELFLHREGDRWILENDRRSANAIPCDNGHEALLMPGLEGSSGRVSPIGLVGHPAGDTPETLRAAYRDSSPEGIALMRAQEAVIAAIHVESQPREWLLETSLDALEIGNLHVLIAPDYRDELGLDLGLAAVAFVEYFTQPDRRPPADLVFLEFHEHLPLYRERWDEILGERMIAGFAGSDAHRNVFPQPMGDGERADSYRRMFKWYANHLLVPEKTPAAAREAFKTGRLYMVFEVLGSPVGFDFHAARGEDMALMGEVIEAQGDYEGVHLRATVPQARIGDAIFPVSADLRLYRVTEEGTTLVAQSDGPLDVQAPGPGRYRLEIDISADHLAPWLTTKPSLLRSYPWIYGNPIEVR